MGYTIKLFNVPFDASGGDTYRFLNNIDRDNFFENIVVDTVNNVGVDFSSGKVDITINYSGDDKLFFGDIDMINYLSIKDEENVNAKTLYYFIKPKYNSRGDFTFRCEIDDVMSYFNKDNLKFGDVLLKRCHIDRFNSDLTFKTNDSRFYVNEISTQKVYHSKLAQVHCPYVLLLSNTTGITYDHGQGVINPILIGSISTNIFLLWIEHPKDIISIMKTDLIGYIIGITTIPSNTLEVKGITNIRIGGDTGITIPVRIVEKLKIGTIDLPNLEGKHEKLFNYQNEPKIYLSGLTIYTFGYLGIEQNEIVPLSSGDSLNFSITNLMGQTNLAINFPNGVNKDNALITEVIDTTIPFASTARADFIASNANYYKQGLELPVKRAWQDTAVQLGQSIANTAIGVINSNPFSTSQAISAIGSSISTGISVGRIKQDFMLKMDNLEKSPNTIKASANMYANMFINLEITEPIYMQLSKHQALEHDLIETASYYHMYGYSLSQIGDIFEHINTRSRFNYIEAELSTIIGVTEDVKMRLKNRLSNGVRFWEPTEKMGDYSLENWERSVLNAHQENPKIKK